MCEKTVTGKPACIALLCTCLLVTVNVTAADSSSTSSTPASEPSVQDILNAANSGQMGKAKKMVEQVLASHPNSAKAHYLAAQIYAKMGERAPAREELSRAQQLDPAMSFVNADQLSQLRAAVGVAGGATVDTESLTEAEHHQVDQLADRLVQQCHSAISSLPLPQNPPPELGLQDYIKADAQGVCECVGTRFRSTVTPALVRNGTEESTRAFTTSVASSCAVEQFKAFWPKACLKFAEFGASLSPDRQLSESKVEEVCSCVQPTVDAMTPATLAEALRQTTADYSDYQRNSSVAMSRPASLASAIQTCIVKAARR
jgi:hypothetical protein